MDPSLDDDGQPSCSAAAALERQEPFINSTLAQHALALMARLFRYGEISYHGGFVDLAGRERTRWRGGTIVACAKF